MISLFWESADRPGRGYVEGYEPGYGRFAMIDDRRGRLCVFTPGLPPEIRSIRQKGAWCRDHVAKLLGEPA